MADGNGHRFRAPRLLSSVIAVAMLLAAAAAVADDWRYVGERNGVRVFTRHAPDSPLKAFRGVTVLEVGDWHALAAVANDYANVPRWLHFVSAVQEFHRRSAVDRDLLFQTDMPWPVADRDAAVRATVVNPPGTYDTTIRFENQPGALPPNEGYIRFPAIEARFDFHWLGERRVEVAYEVSADPGGWVPAWAVNLVLEDAPRVTLVQFAKFVQRPEYQGKHFDYVVTPPPWRAK